ncbi:MAG: PAS domain-containing protein [Usitatibacter sp.]
MRSAAPWQAYLFATAATAATLAARVAFDSAFRGYPALLLFVFPIAMSAYIGGLRGGLMATGLSCAASQYLLILPLRPMVFDTGGYRWLQIFLTVAGVAVSVLCEALQRNGRRALEADRVRESVQALARRDGALLADAQRLAGLGIWDLDVVKNRLSWSEETYRIFGVAPQSFGGTLEAFYALVHPEDLEGLKAIGVRAESMGLVAETQYRILRSDGEVRTVSQRGEVTFNDRGQPVRRTGVVMDITERTAAIEEHSRLARHLELERARLVAAQSVAKVGSWETDLATGGVSWTDETHRIFGTRPEAFSPTHAEFLQRVHSDDRGRVDAAFARSLDSQEPFAIEHRLPMPDGSVKVVEERWRVSFDANGKAKGVLGTCQDVTERKQAEEALARDHGLMREAEARYRSIFENSNDGIFQNTPDGRLLAANPAMARMLGFASVEELVRERTDVERQSYAQPALRREFKRQLQEKGSVNAFEYQVLRKDGTKIWVSENVRLVRDAEGKEFLYEGSVQDITERRRVEAELRQANLELVEASRRAGMAEVATGVLHNVGNVLNSVNVSATLVIDNLKVSRVSRMAAVVKLLRDHHDDLSHYLTADPAGRHIPELLEDLSGDWVAQHQFLATELDDLRANVDLIKRIIASQQGHVGAGAGATESPESVALDQLLDEAVLAQQERLTRQRVRIEREFEHLAPLCVAKRKVVQILASLLRNARQACVASTEIDRCITVRIERLGSRAAISVRDNGTGIAQENLVRIFTPAFSGHQNFGGYGLHACALAAQEIGGELSAASDGVGRGSTFTLELPIELAVAAA